VGEVSLQYVDLGGEENLSVNGEPILELDKLSSVPTNIAPGVTAHVTEKPITGGVRGSLVLEGPIEFLQIGGQEFAIDDVHASPDDTQDKPDDDGSPDDDTDNPDGEDGAGDDDGPQDGDGPAGGNDDLLTIEIGDVVLNLCGAGAAPAMAMCLAGLVTLRFGWRRR
jgi:hypothetical protein